MLTGNGRKVQGISQAVGMRDLPRKTNRFVTTGESLVRIAERPARPGKPGVRCRARFLAPVEPGQGAMLQWIVEGDSLLQMRLGLRQLSKELKGSADKSVCHNDGWILQTLG